LFVKPIRNVLYANVLNYNPTTGEIGYDSMANANYAVFAGTVLTNAQPNITSVGNLSNLTVTGNVSANFFIGDGSQLTGVISANANVANVANYVVVGNGSANSSNGFYPVFVSATGNGNLQLDNFGNVITYVPSSSTLFVNNLDSPTLNFASQRIELQPNLANIITFQADGVANVMVIRDIEIELNKPLQLHSANAATVANITGAVGYMMAVSDQNGQLAYYNTGNVRWEYVANNAAV
jgi:hypothetical protein